MATFEADDFKVSPARFRKAILEDGHAIFRQVIPRERIAILNESLEEVYATFRSFADDAEAMTWMESRAREIGTELRKDSRGFRKHVLYGRTMNSLLLLVTKGQVSVTDLLLKDAAYMSLIHAGLGKGLDVDNKYTNTRQVAAKEVGQFSGEPLAYHTDSQYFGADRFMLNMWMPLTPGAGQSAPGLEVIDRSLHEIQSYLGYENGKLPERTQTDLLSADRVHANWPSQRVMPALDPGDVILFTNWTVHRTHATPEMTGQRTSAEIRLVGNPELTAQIYEPPRRRPFKWLEMFARSGV